VKRIPLTQGQEAIVDDEDFQRLNKYNWRARWDEHAHTFYAQRHTTNNSGRRTTIRMHREVLRASLAEMVDHKDRNGLNNQKENLRRATRSQNQANTRKKSGCASRFKGVSLDRRDGRWYSRIKVEGRTLQLGRFDSEREAAVAYNRAASKHFGEFALLNDV